jgi:5-methylcytosine-specific restriction endonuclease McrA
MPSDLFPWIFEDPKPKKKRAKPVVVRLRPKPVSIVHNRHVGTHSRRVKSIVHRKQESKPIVPVVTVKPKPLKERHPFTSSQKVKFILFVGGCVMPGCDVRQDLEVHHIKPQEDGGLNTDENAVVLCPNHHAKAGNGEIAIAFLKAKSMASLQAVRAEESLSTKGGS